MEEVEKRRQQQQQQQIIVVEKVEIQGPTLSSLLHRISTTSSSNCDGLLFGYFTLHHPSSLSDDDHHHPSSSSTTVSSSSSSATTTTTTSPHLLATVTSFLSPSSSPHFLPDLLLHHHHHHHGDHLLGWFSSRRKSPLRPSLREFSLSLSLSLNSDLAFPVSSHPPSSDQFGGAPPRRAFPDLFLNPCLFMLFTTPQLHDHDHFVHTHEYRSYWLDPLVAKFEPKPIRIVNIGPHFRGHYGDFRPISPFPELTCEVGSSSSMMMVYEKGEEGMGVRKEEMLNEMKSMERDQKELDVVADGFPVEKLRRMVGSEAAGYTAGLEELYEKMLGKFDKLARELETSNELVLEQVRGHHFTV